MKISNKILKKNWTSKTSLMINLDISSDTIEQIISDLRYNRPAYTKKHIMKGGFHSLETYYDDFLVAVITENVKYNICRDIAMQEAKEEGIILEAIIDSGDLKAAQYLCDLIMKKTQIQAEQNKQMEHDLNYTDVIGWKKWSDLKRELAQSFEIFQHRISFKIVAAEAGLVKETDYAERIYGEDCFPTTMISESGIDKIYNCYDR